MLDNSVILLTGGTGSLGKEFIKILLSYYRPEKIIVYSRDELKQHEMSQSFKSPIINYRLGDVRDRDRLNQVMRGVDYVIHAAALKHIPPGEIQPMEYIQTNVYGAHNIINAAIENQVKKVIAISTDKAVNPINLYGATKLTADKLFIAANNISTRMTQFSIVRYGNVIGSRGSVIPFFQKIIREGATELPITDRRMTRFWIELHESVEFILKSLGKMQGGEIFIPKIPSMKITDLAAALAPELPHKIIGIRPGEKLHELLCTKEHSYLTLEFSDCYIIKPPFDLCPPVDFSCNGIGETGIPVPDGFEYSSDQNTQWLTQEQLLKAIQYWVDANKTAVSLSRTERPYLNLRKIPTS